MKPPFYLELERRGAWVYTDVIFIGACLISHHINDKGHFVLDVITTPVDNRNQGHGTKVMTILKDISKTTNTPIELLVGVVKKGGIKMSAGEKLEETCGVQFIQARRYFLTLVRSYAKNRIRAGYA